MRPVYFDEATRAIVNLSPTPEGYEVNRINVPAAARGTGIGRRLMADVTADADQSQTTLYLYVNPYGDLDWDALTSWYHRLGFEPYLTDEELAEYDEDRSGRLYEGTLRRLPRSAQQ